MPRGERFRELWNLRIGNKFSSVKDGRLIAPSAFSPAVRPETAGGGGGMGGGGGGMGGGVRV
jgi:uncharacterized membrane protein